MDPLSCVWFDFGNVLGFFDPGPSCRALAALTTGRWSPSEIGRFILNSQLEDDYECGRITTEVFVEELRAQLDLTAPAEVIADAWTYRFTPNAALCGVIPEIKRAGLRLILASNTNALHTAHFKKQFAKTLRPFDKLILSQEVGARKPDPKFYEACLAAAGCPPGACLYFDDRPDLIEAAGAMGIPGVLYSPAVDPLGEIARRGVALTTA